MKCKSAGNSLVQQIQTVTYLVRGHVHMASHSLDPKLHWWALWMPYCGGMEC